MTAPIRLYSFPLSGHVHRVQLLLSLLGLRYETVSVDLPGGEQRTPAFLALNPMGQVPVIVDGDFTLPDSNAILVYLALRYDEKRRWLPADLRAQAQVQRWLSLAAGPPGRWPPDRPRRARRACSAARRIRSARRSRSGSST